MVAKSASNRDSVAFFVGAGFTKAIAKHAPTGNDFVAKAFRSRWSFSDDPRLQRLKVFLEDAYHPLRAEGEYPRIEDVLSLLDFCVSSHQALNKQYGLEDLREIRGILVFVISEMVRCSLELLPANIRLSRQFVEKVAESGLLAVFVSTNYDIILDNAFLECAESCNYGLPLRKSVELGPEPDSRPVHADEFWRYYVDGNTLRGRINGGKFPLLKIHGSLNWVYCPKCDEIDLTTAEKGAARLIGDNLRYFCSNSHCTCYYEPFLVTPTMMKLYTNRPLQELFRRSEDAIARAERLVFIGYSLPEADYHIRSLLTRAIARRSPDREAKILVIDKPPENAEEKRYLKALSGRYKALFGEKARIQPVGLQGALDSFGQLVVEGKLQE